MRPAVLLIMAAFVGVPALLMLFSSGKVLSQRVFWALAIFVAPFVMVALVHMVPALNGQAPHYQQGWRALGVALSAGAFIVPWCLFAIARGR